MESLAEGDPVSGLGLKGLGKIAAINANWVAATNEKSAALAAANLATTDPNTIPSSSAIPPLSSRSNVSNVSGLSGLGSKRKRDGPSSGRSNRAGEYDDDDDDDDDDRRPPRAETEAERKIRLEGD